jgi:hypothetical protein
MVTWAGALVETRGRADLAAVAAKHRIELIDVDVSAPWLLIHCNVNFAHLNPPQFAEALSRELHTTVIGFFLQSSASVEEIQHWEEGRLVRKLEYTADAGGWIINLGSAQGWEPSYFFPENAGVEEGQDWPLNLHDELTDEDLARYRRARDQKDASAIMDLLSAGSPWSILRLFDHFGVDPKKPGARFTPPANWKPWLIAAGIVAFLIAAVVLGALFPLPR